MTLDVKAIVSALEGESVGADADYRVVAGSRVAHIARSRSGAAALLVPVSGLGDETARLTHGLILRTAASLEFARGTDRWREPTVVVECGDPKLVRTFAALAAAIAARLETATRPSWETVASLFAEWERLLGRRELLKGDAELGLWGELWFLAHSTRSADLLEAWRGPEAEHVDFLLAGVGFEVKTGRREGVHFVSQAQVCGPAGDAQIVLVSLFAKPDPIRGRSLAELVGQVAASVRDLASFEERLAAAGYSRDDEGAYNHRYALLQAPRFFRSQDVPRVRAADPGVSNLRYQVELAPESAVRGSDVDQLTSILGLEIASYGYPCA